MLTVLMRVMRLAPFPPCGLGFADRGEPTLCPLMRARCQESESCAEFLQRLVAGQADRHMVLEGVRGGRGDAVVEEREREQVSAERLAVAHEVRDAGERARLALTAPRRARVAHTSFERAA